MHFTSSQVIARHIDDDRLPPRCADRGPS